MGNRHIREYRRNRSFGAYRSALLIDLDNVVLAGRAEVSPSAGERRLRQVVAGAGACDLSLCVASRRLVRDAVLWPVLRELGITWRLDPGGEDVADRMLIDFALHEIANGGVTRIVVASGDGIFAGLAHHAELEVRVPADHIGVSRALRAYLPAAVPVPVSA